MSSFELNAIHSSLKMLARPIRYAGPDTKARKRAAALEEKNKILKYVEKEEC